MGRSLSWLEPQALAASLARAGVGRDRPAPVRRPPEAPAAPEPLVPAAGAPAATLVQPASRPAALSPPTATDSQQPAAPPAPFTPPAGNLAERLDALCAWLAMRTGCTGVFLADRDGLPVVERQVGDELVAASVLVTRFLDLAHARHRSLGDSGLALRLASGELAYFLQDRGDMGRTCLGLVVIEPIGRETLDEVQRGLQSALASPRPPGEEPAGDSGTGGHGPGTAGDRR